MWYITLSNKTLKIIFNWIFLKFSKETSMPISYGHSAPNWPLWCGSWNFLNHISALLAGSRLGSANSRHERGLQSGRKKRFCSFWSASYGLSAFASCPCEWHCSHTLLWQGWSAPIGTTSPVCSFPVMLFPQEHLLLAFAGGLRDCMRPHGSLLHAFKFQSFQSPWFQRWRESCFLRSLTVWHLRVLEPFIPSIPH